MCRATGRRPWPITLAAARRIKVRLGYYRSNLSAFFFDRIDRMNRIFFGAE